MSNSEEEEIARDYICFSNPDATVVVVDATCLERNLNLVFQIMEITNNVIICVNLLDEAKKKKISINLNKLSTLLGVPVVGTIARNKQSLEPLMQTIFDVCKKNKNISPKKIIYPPTIEESISKIEKLLNNELHDKFKNKSYLPKYLYRWISLQILNGEKDIIDNIEQNFHINIRESSLFKENLEKIKHYLEKENNGHNYKDEIISCIIKKAKEVSKQVCTYENKNYSRQR